MQSKKLGKGLGGLLGIAQAPVRVDVPADQVAPPTPAQIADPLVREIPVAQITPSPFQPRRVMDEGAIARLAESIRRSGVMQPVVVRKVDSGFELVVGERRWRAAQAAGLQTIPASIRELSDEVAAEWALVENVQREDLNPMERAWALRSLIEKFRLTQQQVADRVSLDRASVANLIRLTDIEAPIADMISKGEISAGHGRALLALPPGPDRLELAKQTAMWEWSVRRLESEVRDRAAPEAAKPSLKDREDSRGAVIRDIERRIADHLGTRVNIETDRGGKKGRLLIEFYGLEHFDGLLTRMGVPSR
ncbi:MAG: ParB/RepB/Spo0J family partition protein [Phycisphaerales bacterium]